MLGEGEGIAVGVGEPGYFGGVAGCGPDAGVALVEEGVALEMEAFGGEGGYGLVDVGDLPAEDGEGEWGEVAYADDAEHGSVGVHDEGELVVADEAEAEEAFVEGAGDGGVAGGDEGDDGVVR